MKQLVNQLGAYSVHRKLTLLTAAAITLAVFVASAIFLILDVRRISDSESTQLTAIAETLATNSTAALAFGQKDAALDLLQAARQRKHIRVACILDVDDDVFAIYHSELAKPQFTPENISSGASYTGDGFLEVAVPILDDGDRLGTLFLRETTDELQQAIQSKILAATIVLAISIVIGVFASSHLQELVTSPILRLASTAAQISDDQDYAIRVVHDSEDELGVLYKQFNAMLDQVQLRERDVKRANESLRNLNHDLEQRVAARTADLEHSNAALQRQIEEKDVATQELHETHAQLLEVSRRAGMADIANGVLHNIGNVLNSLNISTNVISEKLRELKFESLERAIGLLAKDQDELAEFLLKSDQGKILPRYLEKLSDGLITDRDAVLSEIESLASNVEHIKDIVRAQQSHAGSFGVMEQMSPCQLFSDAIYFVQDSCAKHEVEIIKDFEPSLEIEIEKNKAIQIIVNLIKNAKESVLEHDAPLKRVTLRVRKEDEFVLFQVSDTGTGIAPERLTTIFSHGYTTKKKGHGFGLHASAIAATEMGGKLSVHSEGVGLGATFTLMLPMSKRANRPILPVSK